MVKKIVVLCAVSAFAMTGCFKKKGKDAAKKHHKVAMHSDANPLTESVFAENDLFAEDVTDFAFADADFLDLDLEDTAVETEQLAQAEEPSDLRFDFNKNELAKDQKELLKQDIELAKAAVQDGKKVVIRGHGCQMGSATYNLALSEKRALAVKKEFVNAGVAEDAVKVMGAGQESPLVWTEATQREEKIAALAPNRRAEILIQEA